MADIFISYSKQDRVLAEQLAGLLEEIGFTVWWDAELIPAEKFRDEIRRQIDVARAVIVIWSHASAKSAFVIDEADVAREAGKLISTLAEGFSVGGVPLGFRNTHMTPLSDGDALIRSLAARGLKSEKSPSRFLLALFRDRVAAIGKRRSWLLPIGLAIAIAGAVTALLLLYLPQPRPEISSPIEKMTASYSYETGDKDSTIKLRTAGVRPFYVRGAQFYVLNRELELIRKEEKTTIFYDTGSWAPSMQVEFDHSPSTLNKRLYSHMHSLFIHRKRTGFHNRHYEKNDKSISCRKCAKWNNFARIRRRRGERHISAFQRTQLQLSVVGLVAKR